MQGNSTQRYSTQMKKVYRRRRIVAVLALLIALAVVIGIVFGIRVVVGAMANNSPSTDTTAVSKTVVPQPAHDVGISDCTASQVKLGLSVQTTSVAQSGSIVFQVSVTHQGMKDCLIDVSAVSRIVTVTSGDQTIWASNVCPVNSRQLLLSGDDHDTQTITWNTKQTGSTCKNGVVTGGSTAKPGTYHAQLSLRDIPSVTSDQVAFTVDAPAAKPSTSDSSTPKK